ncbi:hypothetical protein TNCV_74561 [Trichonephila clavipes]|nr:hypothetical protein TNCV_74561 [Trichonephila clavipes]
MGERNVSCDPTPGWGESEEVVCLLEKQIGDTLSRYKQNILYGFPTFRLHTDRYGESNRKIPSCFASEVYYVRFSEYTCQATR